MRAKVASLKLN